MTSRFTSINKLAGTRVLIVGGTSGIGFGVARAALEHGASIIIASSQSTKVEAALSRLRETYPEEEYTNRIAGFTCDLGNEETVEANAVQLLKNATSPNIFPSTTSSSPSSDIIPLDHIVYTAGDVPEAHPLTSPALNVAYIHKNSTTRFLGALFLAKHSIPTYLSPSSTSSITFTSGTSATKPIKGLAVPAAMLAAVEGLTRGLAVDLAPVRVNAVSPGAVMTELLERFLGNDDQKREGLLGMFARETLVGGVGRVEDVAEAYLYLMKDGFVSGVVLESSGGRLLK
ncbi:hypothetical protein ASPWEDRAFT_45167 [Aspergillus wentii DTO 134E9]|uniref:Ketoreductase (KR) domain-containing protein n=1 Tax=Aspergillus wentii DTO 134E9 TaxID=1073089 RepID=A0A1L9R8I9_ASPWE|nr:uncharacterized protein ASPWEDRAFT_45167 [Aspergillus wentii DTO 134E9]KAI9925035.1 hypothetical protein MW887_006442 [Aspergillus wentii]OJJ31208.1 hypothetical protein ASPWEDRAFT_45167 [Aspergillus wentii DTO 134E9]